LNRINSQEKKKKKRGLEHSASSSSVSKNKKHERIMNLLRGFVMKKGGASSSMAASPSLQQQQRQEQQNVITINPTATSSSCATTVPVVPIPIINLDCTCGESTRNTTHHRRRGMSSVSSLSGGSGGVDFMMDEPHIMKNDHCNHPPLSPPIEAVLKVSSSSYFSDESDEPSHLQEPQQSDRLVAVEPEMAIAILASSSFEIHALCNAAPSTLETMMQFPCYTADFLDDRPTSVVVSSKSSMCLKEETPLELADDARDDDYDFFVPDRASLSPSTTVSTSSAASPCFTDSEEEVAHQGYRRNPLSDITRSLSRMCFNSSPAKTCANTTTFDEANKENIPPPLRLLFDDNPPSGPSNLRKQRPLGSTIVSFSTSSSTSPVHKVAKTTMHRRVSFDMLPLPSEIDSSPGSAASKANLQQQPHHDGDQQHFVVVEKENSKLCSSTSPTVLSLTQPPPIICQSTNCT
jgi:hypothetical protein